MSKQTQHDYTQPPPSPTVSEPNAKFWELVGQAEKLAKQLGKHCRCFISVQSRKRNVHITFEEGEKI